MVLPLLKLGTLALKTLSKPVASRLKQQAALHPRFREFIVSIAQVLICCPWFAGHSLSIRFNFLHCCQWCLLVIFISSDVWNQSKFWGSCKSSALENGTFLRVAIVEFGVIFPSPDWPNLSFRLRKTTLKKVAFWCVYLSSIASFFFGMPGSKPYVIRRVSDRLHWDLGFLSLVLVKELSHRISVWGQLLMFHCLFRASLLLVQKCDPMSWCMVSPSAAFF